MSEDEEEDSKNGGLFTAGDAVEAGGCCLLELFGALTIFVGLILLPPGLG